MSRGFHDGFDNHAIEAFKLGAIDYLLKPITDDRLRQTIERIKQQLKTVPCRKIYFA